MIQARTKDRRSRPGMLMLGLLALCALLGGQPVVATHVHPAHPVARGDGGARSSIAAVADDCALCDAVAAFEPFLPGDALVVPPVFATPLLPAVAPRTYGAPTIHGHGWHSRAPPHVSPT